MSSLVPLHAMTPQDALRVLGSSVQGLSTAEAGKRLKDAQTWRVAPPKVTGAARTFLRQLVNPFVTVLLAAVVFSWWGGDYLEASITLAIVFVNAFLGFFQEMRADREFLALQKYLPRVVSVRRDGVVRTLSADDMVPGDVMVLRAGQNIVADGRIIDAAAFSVVEAALSGESSAIEKHAGMYDASAPIFERRNMVYAGTAVTAGQASVVVNGVGTQTEFGKIGTFTTSVADRETPLAAEMRRFSRVLTVLILIIAAGTFAIALGRGMDVVLAFTIAAALAIAAIPEGLPMTMTVLLSAAMRRMLRRGVLVRHMVATEALGAVNVLCVDKTGTLTTGEMTVVEVRTLQGVVEKGAVFQREIGDAFAAFADQHRRSGDGVFAGAATSGAIARYVGASGEVSCVATLPFDPAFRFSACRTERGTTYVMGAPDALLSRLAQTEDAEAYRVLVQGMTAHGYRVVMIGACKTSGPLSPDAIGNVQALACVGIEDPLRASVPGAIAQAEIAGIRTIMITGDHPETARIIGSRAFEHREIRVMLGDEFIALSPADRIRAVREVSVFARMLPEHKLRVVETLHAQGLRVAMTGDGVNDAPALKAADVGIAVGHATEVAKEASDMVLIDGDFGNIVAAVGEGRTVFTNARNVTLFLLALGLKEVFCIVGGFLFGLPLPLSPLLILWLNIVTGGIPGLFFAFESRDPHAMREQPRDARDGLMSGNVREYLLQASIILFVVVLSLMAMARITNIPATELRSITYLGVGTLGLLFLFVTKSLRSSFFTNIRQRSVVRIGALLGFLLLFVPFLVPVLRDAFGVAWPPVSHMGIAAIALVILLVALDLTKRRFSPPISGSRYPAS